MPRRPCLAWSACALALAFGPPGAAAQTPEHPPRFTTGTSAVVLDVVVRDRDRRSVTGLTRDDFEVFEDRRRQTIRVFAGPGAAPAPAPASPSITPPAPAIVLQSVDATSPRVVALAFEQLGPASRALAAQAARRLVEALEPGDFAAVFTIDRAVQPVLGYAPPSPAVGTAIDTATARAGMPLRRAGSVPGAEFQSGDSGHPRRATRPSGRAASRCWTRSRRS